jgi:hypothetical protein
VEKEKGQLGADLIRELHQTHSRNTNIFHGEKDFAFIDRTQT